MLPSGAIATDAISRGIDALHAAGWPSEPLWVCAVRSHATVSGWCSAGDAPPAPVGQAVAASCAVPAYFRPVSIDGKRYIDGGVRSFINADLVREMGLDLVIVSSPMTQAPAGPIPGAIRAARRPLRARCGWSRRPAPVRHTGRRHRAGAGGGPGYGPQPPDARPRALVSRTAYASICQWLGEHPEGRRVAAVLGAAATARTAGRAPGSPAEPAASA